MSATYKYNFKRWSLRGKSDLMSITAMPAMTTLAYDRMAAAQWIEVSEQESDLPPHDWAQSGFQDSYDAAKYCGDYAAGKQIAYACAACYSIKLPADALAGTAAKVEAILATVYGDRWLSEGAIISAFLTSSATPPAWADIVDGSTALASSPDPAPAADAVTVPDWKAPLRQITRANTAPDNDYAATLAPATATDATAYLHVVIRLSDYISVPQLSITGGGTRDSAWIEGGAKIDGTTLAVQFDRAVTPDAGPVLVAYHRNWGRTKYDPLYGPHSYDVDLSFRMFRKNDALTGVKHYRALLAQQRYPLAVLRSIDSDIDGTIINLYKAQTVTTANFLGNAGFFKETAPFAENCTYAMAWLLYGREVRGGGKTVNAISFPDAAIAAPTVGMTLRLSVFGAVGGYHITNTGNPGDPNEFTFTVPPQMISFDSVTDPKLFGGASTTLSFIQTANYESADDPQNINQANYNFDSTTIGASVPLTLLASVDITSAIPAGTMVPFAAPYAVPDSGMIFCVLTPADVSDSYAVDKDTNDVVQWFPRDFNLHIV
jgi:hypothetical protein